MRSLLPHAQAENVPAPEEGDFGPIIEPIIQREPEVTDETPPMKLLDVVLHDQLCACFVRKTYGRGQESNRGCDREQRGGGGTDRR